MDSPKQILDIRTVGVINIKCPSKSLKVLLHLLDNPGTVQWLCLRDQAQFAKDCLEAEKRTPLKKLHRDNLSKTEVQLVLLDRTSDRAADSGNSGCCLPEAANTVGLCGHESFYRRRFPQTRGEWAYQRGTGVR